MKFKFASLAVVGLLLGCSSGKRLVRIQKDLNQYPQYSIVLEDMKREGNFFSDYYHRYKYLYSKQPEPQSESDFQTKVTDWIKVNRKEYERLEPYLGMAIATKTPEGKSNVAEPAGYRYVGNPRYGRWVNDRRGSSFWEFYGKYAMFNTIFNMTSRPVYRRDWDSYREYRRNRRPFFGSKRQFGTNGSATKTSHKSFYQRKSSRQKSRNTSFSKKVKQRTNRSNMSPVRRRSGSYGK